LLESDCCGTHNRTIHLNQARSTLRTRGAASIFHFEKPEQSLVFLQKRTPALLIGLSRLVVQPGFGYAPAFGYAMVGRVGRFS
jgi:hypothetical protein